ncbi:MAG: hypothetical protein A2X46_06590 [Lentisphaerae bacterium GWF2_57_35]|nr:MAG: hypothetical protein A2X46_06590 [Lentisphaerae bacterium GWF2_57_35]
MITRTPLGVSFFDRLYGGIYRGRSCLVTGRSGSGKTAVSLHFLSHGLMLQERCLMLCAKPAQDIAIHASSLGLPVQSAVESGNLILLEYSDFVPGRDREETLILPPDAFLQLKEIIEAQAIQRLIIDTVLPWITLPDREKVAEHVFSFVRAIDRLGVSTLFTMLKPVSVPAFQLRQLMENLVPISISLVYTPENESREWVTNKYMGMNIQAQTVKYNISQGQGLYEISGADAPEASVSAFSSYSAAPDVQPNAASDRTPPMQKGFADFVLDKTAYRAAPLRTHSVASVRPSSDKPGGSPSVFGSPK